MKSLPYAKAFLAALTITATGFAEPSINCNDIYGVWSGDLGALSQARIYIHPNDGMEDVDVSFRDADGMHIEYGMLTGSCQVNSDGSISANYSRNKYGASVNLTAQLTSPHQLIVSELSYSDYMNHGSGSGSLTK